MVLVIIRHLFLNAWLLLYRSLGTTSLGYWLPVLISAGPFIFQCLRDSRNVISHVRSNFRSGAKFAVAVWLFVYLVCFCFAIEQFRSHVMDARFYPPRPPASTPPYNANVATDFGPPDVALRFVGRVTPALVIINTSDSLAREIKWTVVLWDMDRPDQVNPLPIPVSAFDWLRPHSSSAMLDLFGGPAVSPPRKQGDRLFGSASVICPNCRRGRTYIVFIVCGEGGWFSEYGREKSGGTLTPRGVSLAARESYFKSLEAAAPIRQRIALVDP
jgi:hypothetical protein